jgi:DNA-binding protein YbaB
MNGAGELVDIEIDNSLMDDKESLQILLIAAINEVSSLAESSKTKAQREMAMSMLGGGNMFGNKQ